MTISEDSVREELKKVIDPELFVNIVDLGLIYVVNLEEKEDDKVDDKDEENDGYDDRKDDNDDRMGDRKDGMDDKKDDSMDRKDRDGKGERGGKDMDEMKPGEGMLKAIAALLNNPFTKTDELCG